jgi:hypothetical protein
MAPTPAESPVGGMAVRITKLAALTAAVLTIPLAACGAGDAGGGLSTRIVAG